MEGPIRILHVEDDPDFAELTETALEREDDRFAVEIAADAEEGLARLDEGAHGCVVSDYEMPGTDGIEFLEAVRERAPDLPFILFTGKGGEEVASEAITAGVTDYLQKGSGIEQYAILANRIRNAVEKYEAQLELKGRERRLEALLEHSTERISIVDEDGRYTFVSPATERLLGYPTGDLEGEFGLEYVHPDDRERADETFRRAVENPGEVYSAEYRYQHGSEGWRWVKTRAVYRGDDPAIGGTIINSRDITEQKERERELVTAKERLELALEGGNFGVYDWNVQTNEISFDERVSELLGYPPEKFDGHLDSWRDLAHSDDLERIQRGLEELYAGEIEYSESEYRMKAKSGEWRWIRSVGKVAERDEDGEPLRIVGVHYDVTERKQRENEIERQNERLQRFAGILAHDLRTPINVAAARVRGLQRDVEDRRLDQVSRALDRMATLVEDVLALTRGGREVVDPDPVELAGAATRAWSMADVPDAQLEIEGTPGRLRADESRLEQLLDNLFRNAREHAGEGVIVRIGRVENGFYVVDDGPGIPPEERDDVFESGHTTSEEGTGYGLTIVKEIAEAHGWDVRVAEGRDGGARFEFSDVVFPG